MAKNSPQARQQRAAELLKQQQQARRRQAGMVGGIVVVLLLLVAGGGWWLLSSNEPEGGPKDSEYGLVVGDADAPVTMVIYEDFLCPACGLLETETGAQLQAAADAGKVQIEYRPFNFLTTFGDYSERAANAFRAVWDQAGPEAAKEFHDSLFAEQPTEGGPYPDDDWFVEKAVAAGADEAEIRPAIENMEYQDWVEAATDDASDVRATPTVYINDEIVDEGTMGDVIARVLAAIE